MNANTEILVSRPVICGMWGTSSLSVSLVDGQTGDIIETREGLGVSKLKNDSLEDEFFRICSDWIEKNSVTDAYLGGMVGSTLGWWEVPYVECPTSLNDLASECRARKIKGVNIHISSGLKCQNFLGEPDVIRGEEIEILAWMQSPQRRSQLQENGKARSLLCIPGTHTKWVEVVGETVTKFQTGIAGELFDLLTENGVLASKEGSGSDFAEQAFIDGVNAIIERPESLLQQLMSVRARSLLSGQSAQEASDRLSGLLIGSDVVNALKLVGDLDEAQSLPIVGNKSLAQRYALALQCLGINPQPLDSVYFGVAGLFSLAQVLRTQ